MIRRSALFCLVLLFSLEAALVPGSILKAASAPCSEPGALPSQDPGSGGITTAFTHLALSPDAIGDRIDSPESDASPDGEMAPGWVTIVSEDFEGAFPGQWQVLDDKPGLGDTTGASATAVLSPDPTAAGLSAVGQTEHSFRVAATTPTTRKPG